MVDNVQQFTSPWLSLITARHTNNWCQRSESFFLWPSFAAMYREPIFVSLGLDWLTLFVPLQPSGLSKLSSFEQTEPEAAVLEDSHMAPDPSQPAYKIRATDFRGTTPRSQAKLDNNELYFAIDWDPSAVQEYDPECMEEPQIHSSTEEARARNREGPRPCTLQECLEASLSWIHFLTISLLQLFRKKSYCLLWNSMLLAVIYQGQYILKMRLFWSCM